MTVERMKIGIYNLNMSGLGGGDKQTLALAEHLGKRNEVYLFTREPIDIQYCEAYFEFDLSKLTVVLLRGPEQSLQWIPGAPRLYYHRLHILHYRQIMKYQLDVFFNYEYGSQLRPPAKHGVYMCMFPTEPTITPAEALSKSRLSNKLIRFASSAILKRELFSFESYKTVTAVSEFTAKWISTIWGRESIPVYAVCDPIESAEPKRKYILSVGRFIAFDPLVHHKRQDVIISEFIRMKELHSDGWELHLAGTININNNASLEYAEQLIRLCEGYPVYFHFNASRSELVELYQRSTVYLHATGYGTESQDSPHSQEHFGITTVEAMSAGCIPIVINSGGQPEIVTDGVNGFLWNDLEELRQCIHSVTSDEASNLRRRLSTIEAGNRFTRDIFNSRIDDILMQMVN